MTLTVITHTQGKRPELMRRCQSSVEAALPPGATHKIIHTDTYEAWAESRVRSVMESDIACFVDDDDEIDPMVLRHCLAALEGNDLGVACSNEITVMFDGRKQMPQRIKTYEAIYQSPREVHHLCMIRGKHVDPRIVDDLKALDGIGADWLVKASAALTAGAIHVPHDGYFWHVNTPDSDIMRVRMRYMHTMPKLRAILSRYTGRHGRLPQWDLDKTPT